MSIEEIRNDVWEDLARLVSVRDALSVAPEDDVHRAVDAIAERIVGMRRVVTLRRVPDHVYAEIGAVPRCVGNVSPRRDRYEWSSLNAQGVVWGEGRASLLNAEWEMIAALRREGFEVDTEASPRAQAVACPECGVVGQKGCPVCHGTGRVWPDGNVVNIEAARDRWVRLVMRGMA